MSRARFFAAALIACLAIISIVGCGGGGGGSTDQPIIIPPDDGNSPNQGPSITSLSPASSSAEPIKVNTGETITFIVSASDPDNDPLTYSWAATSGTVGTSGQQVNYTAPGSVGSAEVTVTVTDGKHTPVTARAYILVGNGDNDLPTNHAPTVVLNANSPTAPLSGTVTLTATAQDQDGDALSYTWFINAGSIQTNNKSSIVWKAPGTAGTYSITVSVSDGKAASVLASTAITVGDGATDPVYTNGLTGRYYKNDGSMAHPNFKSSDFKFERIDPTINFVWGRGVPDPALIDPSDGKARDFNVRWTGHIRCDAAGTYTFYARYDDGVRLYIGNDQGQMINVIDGWLTGPSATSGQITLQGGKWYPIVVEYFEDESTAYAQLFWTPPGSAVQEIVPTLKLRSD